MYYRGVTEEDIDYHGNTVSRMTQPDVDSCRSSCSCMGAPYFSYNDKMKFKCKDSDAGRRAKVGNVSGDTSCVDNCLGWGVQVKVKRAF